MKKINSFSIVRSRQKKTKSCKFCIHLYYARKKFHENFRSKMVTFSARNTNIYKIYKLRRAIFSYFTTFRHQTCISNNFKILFLNAVKDFILLAQFDL